LRGGEGDTIDMGDKVACGVGEGNGYPDGADGV